MVALLAIFVGLIAVTDHLEVKTKEQERIEKSRTIK